MNKFWKDHWESQKDRLNKLFQKTYAETQDKKFVYCIGDCFVEGVGTENEPGMDFPNQLQGLLGDKYKIVNLGLTMLQMRVLSSTFSEFFAERIKSGNVVVILCSSNDFFFEVLVNEVFDWYANFCKLLGINSKIIAMTLLPRSAGTPKNFEINRLAFNGLLRERHLEFCDGLADLAADNLIGYAGAEGNALYYCQFSGNNTHPNGTGYGIIAKIVYDEIMKIA